MASHTTAAPLKRRMQRKTRSARDRTPSPMYLVLGAKSNLEPIDEASVGGSDPNTPRGHACSEAVEMPKWQQSVKHETDVPYWDSATSMKQMYRHGEANRNQFTMGPSLSLQEQAWSAVAAGVPSVSQWNRGNMHAKMQPPFPSQEHVSSAIPNTRYFGDHMNDYAGYEFSNDLNCYGLSAVEYSNYTGFEFQNAVITPSSTSPWQAHGAYFSGLVQSAAEVMPPSGTRAARTRRHVDHPDKPQSSNKPAFANHQGQLDSQLSKPPSVMSVGSAGHPQSCGKACKYNGKKAGCKDGELCERCHICIWTRGAERVAADAARGAMAINGSKAKLPAGTSKGEMATQTAVEQSTQFGRCEGFPDNFQREVEKHSKLEGVYASYIC